MLGGVIVNFITALVIYSAVLYVWGDSYLPNKNVTHGVMVDSLAYDIGLRNGDKIISLDGEKIDDFYSIHADIVLEDVQEIQVERDGEKLDVEVPESIIPQLLKTQGFISPRIPFQVGGFVKDSPAKEAGLKVGDQLVAINNSSVQYFDEFKDTLSHYKNHEVKLAAVRDKDTVFVSVLVPESGLIGVAPGGSLGDFFELEQVEYSLMASIPAGVDKGLETFGSYLKQLKLIFSPKTEAYKSLGGFITIGKIFPGTWNWQAFWNLTAFLSIILAIMNVLPIPALDGGHVMFLLYEMVTGRKPSDKFMEYAQITGMIILLALLLYANGNDIFRLFNNG
jgi:regulator of sigma E protease